MCKAVVLTLEKRPSFISSHPLPIDALMKEGFGNIKEEPERV